MIASHSARIVQGRVANQDNFTATGRQSANSSVVIDNNDDVNDHRHDAAIAARRRRRRELGHERRRQCGTEARLGRASGADTRRAERCWCCDVVDGVDDDFDIDDDDDDDVGVDSCRDNDINRNIDSNIDRIDDVDVDERRVNAIRGVGRLAPTTRYSGRR